jgi:hypothetical protein
MRKRLITAVLAAIVVMATLPVQTSHAASELDFSIVNKTGYGIKELYVAPSASTDWNDNLLEEPLENNEEVAITFSPDADAAKWDIMIVWVDGGDKVYWKGLKLAEIAKVTLKYDRASGQTTAVTE